MTNHTPDTERDAFEVAFPDAASFRSPNGGYYGEHGFMFTGWEAKADAREQYGWRTIDSAPKDGTHILLETGLRVLEASWGVCRPQVDGYRANNGKPCWRTQSEKKIVGGSAVRWMPLPLPLMPDNAI
jgi:hypothetical protein